MTRIIYKSYLNKKNKKYSNAEKPANKTGLDINFGTRNEGIQHVYCIGDSEIIGTTKKTLII